MAQIVVINSGGWRRGGGGRSSNKYTATTDFNGDGWDEEDCKLVGSRVEEKGMRVMRRGEKRRTGPTGEMTAAFPTLFGWLFRSGFQQVTSRCLPTAHPIFHRSTCPQ